MHRTVIEGKALAVLKGKNGRGLPFYFWVIPFLVSRNNWWEKEPSPLNRNEFIGKTLGCT